MNADDASKVLVVLDDAVQSRTFVARWGDEAFTYRLQADAVATFVRVRGRASQSAPLVATSVPPLRGRRVTTFGIR